MLSQFDFEKNLLYLKRLPIGLYNFYIENKNLYRYSTDLAQEFDTVLKEFQELDEEFEEIRRKFLNFLEEAQNILNGKEWEIASLHNEIERKELSFSNFQTENKEINEIKKKKNLK